jgi:hypothetical protein
MNILYYGTVTNNQTVLMEERIMLFRNDDGVEVVNFDKELKRRQGRERAIEHWNQFAGFVRSNQDVLVFAVPATLTVIGGGTKVLSKIIANRTAEREIRFKERTIYDRSLGRYVNLKRPLRAHEALEIERRRMNGEKLNAILADMRLIK